MGPLVLAFAPALASPCAEPGSTVACANCNFEDAAEASAAGSFKYMCPKEWTCSGGTILTPSGSAPWGGTTTADGTPWLGLQMQGASASKTVSGLTPQKPYVVEFTLAERRQSADPNQQITSLRVELNGQTIIPLIEPTITWSKFSHRFVGPASGTATFVLTNTGPAKDQTVFVDRLTVGAERSCGANANCEVAGPQDYRCACDAVGGFVGTAVDNGPATCHEAADLAERVTNAEAEMARLAGEVVLAKQETAAVIASIDALNAKWTALGEALQQAATTGGGKGGGVPSTGTWIESDGGAIAISVAEGRSVLVNGERVLVESQVWQAVHDAIAVVAEAV